MVRSELNPNLALILIVALWGLAGWLDQPMEPASAATIGRESSLTAHSARRGCAAWEADDGSRGFGPSPVVFTIDANGDDVIDADPPAAAHRCPAPN